jgi:hypothetical protein|tara:strand:- start:241 stop:447 length:207 start_codon:yes stop_codon:yes gene_type:complete
MESQNKQLKEILNRGSHISQLDALRWINSMRLAARIYDIKQEGFPVDSYKRKENDKYITYYYKVTENG